MTEQRDADDASANSQQFKEPTEGATTESVDDSWTSRIAGVWNNATSGLMGLRPVEQVAQTVVGCFSFSDAHVAVIWDTVLT